jgi:cell division protein ZapD
MIIVMTNMIIYEQPLNEVIRACLRLEQLFVQIDHEMNDTSTIGTRNVMLLIINVLHLLDRPDLKSKLAKELSQVSQNLSRYSNLPEIDSEKLREITRKLDDLSRLLIDSSGKIGQRLRDIELLNSLRLHLASPGGACSFDIPLYHCWLQKPAEERHAIIKDWLTDFDQIKDAVEILLDLVRKNAKTEQKTAIHGFHQELLDPQSNLRLIRISVDRAHSVFPEFSVGRHFLSIRWFVPDILKRPAQYAENLTFSLEYCH